MLEFNLFKIPVRVEPIFWITLGLIGFLSNRNAAGDQIFLMTALFMLAGFISILIHEFGHALMIKKYKLPTQVVLSSFGGYATHPAGILDRKQSFLMTLAGPAIQATFGFAVLYTAPYLNIGGTLVEYFIWILAIVSLYWAALNCLPIIPLDGGRMLEAALGPRRIKLTLQISIAVAVIVAAISFMRRDTFLGIFMAMFAFQNYQTYEKFR